MKIGTYRRLCALHARHGPREFGKICQKLVALAFRAGGCGHIVERGVQGVDIDMVWGAEKYATEIKTTQKNVVQLAWKDLAGLMSRSQDGYRPLLGVLQLRPLSDWLLVHATFLKVGEVPIDSLRPCRCVNLESRLRLHFDGVLEAHFDLALLASQGYLDRMLRAGSAGDACHR